MIKEEALAKLQELFPGENVVVGETLYCILNLPAGNQGTGSMFSLWHESGARVYQSGSFEECFRMIEAERLLGEKIKEGGEDEA